MSNPQITPQLTPVTPQLTPTEFAQMVKTKHPEYKDVPDVLLTQKMLTKHPEYKSRIKAGPAIGQHPSTARLEIARQTTNTPQGGAGYQSPGYWQEQTANANAAASAHFDKALSSDPKTSGEIMRGAGHILAGEANWALGGVGKAVGGVESIKDDPGAGAAIGLSLATANPLPVAAYFGGQALSAIPGIAGDIKEHGLSVGNTQDAVLTAFQLGGSAAGVRAGVPGAAAALNKAPKLSAEIIRNYTEHVANRKLGVAADPDTGISPGGALSRAMDETTKLKNLQAKGKEIVAKQHGQLTAEIDKAETAGVKMDAETPLAEWLHQRSIKERRGYPPSTGKTQVPGMTYREQQLVPYLKTWGMGGKLSNIGPREGQLLRDSLDGVIYNTKEVPSSVLDAAQRLRTIIDQGFDEKVTNWKTLNHSMSGITEAVAKAKARYADNAMGKFKEQLRLLIIPQSYPEAAVILPATYVAYQLAEMLGGGMYGHIAVTAGLVEAIRGVAKTMSSATMRMKYLNRFADLLHKEVPSGPVSYPSPGPPRPGLPPGPAATGPGAGPGGSSPFRTNVAGPSTAGIQPQAQLPAPQQPLGQQMPPSGGTPPGGIPKSASSLTPQRVMEITKQAYEEATAGVLEKGESARPLAQKAPPKTKEKLAAAARERMQRNRASKKAAGSAQAAEELAKMGGSAGAQGKGAMETAAGGESVRAQVVAHGSVQYMEAVETGLTALEKAVGKDVAEAYRETFEHEKMGAKQQYDTLMEAIHNMQEAGILAKPK